MPSPEKKSGNRESGATYHKYIVQKFRHSEVLHREKKRTSEELQIRKITHALKM